MKILLRNRSNRLLYTGQAGTAKWSKDEKLAFDFLTCTDAEKLCSEQGLTEVEIMAIFGENNVSFIPVRPPPQKK